MRYCNKTGWTNPFTVNPFLMSEINPLSQNTYYKSLRNLHDAGLILWNKGKHNVSNQKITMLNFKVSVDTSTNNSIDNSIKFSTNASIGNNNKTIKQLNDDTIKQLNKKDFNFLLKSEEFSSFLKSKKITLSKAEPQSRLKITFEDFWKKYHELTKKPEQDKARALNRWKQLNNTEKQKAFDLIGKYSKTSTNSQYLKLARTYLASKSFNDEMRIDNTGTSFTYKNHIQENKNETKINFYLHFLHKLKERAKHNSPYPAKFASLDKPFLYQDFYSLIDWERLETFEEKEQYKKVGTVGSLIKFEDKREFLTQFGFLTQKYLR